MKQSIPFTKDITFKTKIGEITSISLDNDLMLKGEDLISGNFYISGTYKMLTSSAIEETYSYKIPCEIAISDDYDTFEASIDIDDFRYEIVDDEILRVNIVVAINNLQKKEVLIEEEKMPVTEIELLKEERCIEDEDKNEEKDEEKIEESLDSDDKEQGKNLSFLEVKESVKNEKDTYLTYKVYIFKDGDTIDKILEKYNITKDELSDYNDLEDITIGTKLVIPSSNDKL